jgi:glycosyltransferase 2 family protein
VAIFYLTFPVRTLRWRALLENAGESNLPSVNHMTRITLLGSFANSVSVAQLGDLYRGYLLKQDAGVSLPTTLGTVLVERMLDLVTLIGLLTAAALTAHHGRLPSEAVDALVGGFGLSIVGMLVLVTLPRSRALRSRP